MGAVSVKLNGQRVKLTAAKTHEDDATVAVYASSSHLNGATNALTLPYLLTADTTIYLANGERKLTFTQEDGTALGTFRVTVQGNQTQPVDLRPDRLAALADLEFLKQLVRTGTGSPEGVVTAPVRTIYLRDDGGASTTLYVKTSGSSNTGWTAK